MTTTVIVATLLIVAAVLVLLHLNKRPKPADYDKVDDRREVVDSLPDYRSVPATPFTGNLDEVVTTKEDGATVLRHSLSKNRVGSKTTKDYRDDVDTVGPVVLGSTVYPVVVDSDADGVQDAYDLTPFDGHFDTPAERVETPVETPSYAYEPAATQTNTESYSSYDSGSSYSSSSYDSGSSSSYDSGSSSSYDSGSY